MDLFTLVYNERHTNPMSPLAHNFYIHEYDIYEYSKANVY